MDKNREDDVFKFWVWTSSVSTHDLELGKTPLSWEPQMKSLTAANKDVLLLIALERFLILEKTKYQKQLLAIIYLNNWEFHILA